MTKAKPTHQPVRRRQQQRAVETRSLLMNAATAMFSSKGFEGVSVRQLEEGAGTNRGLVGYHFIDKDHLWRAVVDQLFSDLAENFFNRLETLSDVSAQEAAKGLIRAFVRYSAANPALNRIMMQESMSDSWRVAYLVDNHIRPMLDNLGATMPEAAELILGDRSPHRYYVFIGASAFVFSAEQECRRLFDAAPRDPEFVERHADGVIAVLMGG
jgi:AcrR family transcriptional regulator